MEWPKINEKMEGWRIVNVATTSICIIAKEQHGFIENHSTCTALISITDEILRGMDRSEITF